MKQRLRTRILSGCPIDYALEIFGDRWSLLVLRDLLVRRKRHFREMMASDEGIASNILAARLRKLEAWGLIARAPDPANKRQAVYTATAKGREIAPLQWLARARGLAYDRRPAHDEPGPRTKPARTRR
mgnify:CR=1 FL=1